MLVSLVSFLCVSIAVTSTSPHSPSHRRRPMPSRAFHKFHHKDLSHKHKTGKTVPKDRDPTHDASIPEAHHGKPTVEIGGAHFPARNLIKQFTNYVDSIVQSDTSNYSTAFLQSIFIDFELDSLSSDSVNRAILSTTLRNDSPDVGWTLPNLWDLIESIKVMWNGNDEEESYDKSQIREAMLLFNRDIESTGRLMHFNPPSAGPGRAFLPRNQGKRCTVYDAVNDVAGIDYDTPADVPTSIPSTDPLYIPPNSSRVFRIDLSWLPLFSGHIHFPSVIHKGSRVRIYFDNTNNIIGDSTYSNSDLTIGGVTKKAYVYMAEAQAANRFVVQNVELHIKGVMYTNSLMREELTRRHQVFGFKCLLPRRMFVTQDCTTGTQNEENKALTSMAGTFALWTIYLRDGDAETAARKAGWFNGIVDITEVTSDGHPRDYSRKPAYLFANLTDQINFPGGNDYFTNMSDYGQSMYADPRNRGTTRADGTIRAIGSSADASTPYRHSDGQEARVLGLPYSAQPMKDFWWGTQYGGQHFNGKDSLKFTPGRTYGGHALAATKQNLWICGWQYSTIMWNGEEWTTTKQ